MSVTNWTSKTYASGGFGQRFHWIDFVNSEHWNGFGVVADHLAENRWRDLFIISLGLPKFPRSGFPLATFKRLRARLRAAADQISGSGDLTPDDLRILNKTLSRVVYRTIERNAHDYQMVINPRHVDWGWAGSQIVSSFGAFLELDQAHRLKICPNRGCRWVFFDETRGNTRRWCNDRRCGNRDKVRRYRAIRRRKDARAPRASS